MSYGQAMTNHWLTQGILKDRLYYGKILWYEPYWRQIHKGEVEIKSLDANNQVVINKVQLVETHLKSELVNKSWLRQGDIISVKVRITNFGLTAYDISYVAAHEDHFKAKLRLTEQIKFQHIVPLPAKKLFLQERPANE